MTTKPTLPICFDERGKRSDVFGQGELDFSGVTVLLHTLYAIQDVHVVGVCSSSFQPRRNNTLSRIFSIQQDDIDGLALRRIFFIAELLCRVMRVRRCRTCIAIYQRQGRQRSSSVRPSQSSQAKTNRLA